MIAVLLLALSALVAASSPEPDPSYDHQTKTYTQTYPAFTASPKYMTATPYFSPDHSVDTQVKFLEAATASIDIANPSYDAWTYCSTPSESCTGCLPASTRNDSFPIFAVLLNAIHRGVTVRIMSNDYGDDDCTGYISPLPFLQLNGAQVRWYASTTFDHSKFMIVDGKVVLISSINFSETSYLQNREAGVVFSGETDGFANYTQEIFNADWALALELQISQTYTSAELEVITDKATVPIPPYTPFSNPAAYITPTPEPIDLDEDNLLTIYTSPDFAREQLFYDMGNASESLSVHIYQITDMGICDEIAGMHKAGINVTLLVSQLIYDTTDCDLAIQCYKYLYGAGLTIHKTPSYYAMSHQKYWIVDGTRMSLSTGNWSPSDYPIGSSFPPYGNSAWQIVNRDYSFTTNNANVIAVYHTTMFEDLARGTLYDPSTTSGSIECGFSG